MLSGIRLSLLTVSLLCCSFFVASEDELAIAVGFAKPPYVIQKNDSGFELDLIQAVFAQLGKSVKFIYVPFGHSPKMLQVDEIDAVLTLNANLVQDKSVLSEPYIAYQNVAISLKEKALEVNSIADLKQYRTVAFQNAQKILGSEYAAMVRDSQSYSEISDQIRQPMLLVKDRCDVLVMDINIFDYLIKGTQAIDVSAFQFHFIFPKVHYQAAFKDRKILKLFNEQLGIYMQSQAYQALVSKYEFRQ